MNKGFVWLTFAQVFPVSDPLLSVRHHLIGDMLGCHKREVRAFLRLWYEWSIDSARADCMNSNAALSQIWAKTAH